MRVFLTSMQIQLCRNLITRQMVKITPKAYGWDDYADAVDRLEKALMVKLYGKKLKRWKGGVK